VQERFASIIAASSDDQGRVDKAKLLELLRLSPDDPVTLVIDILISNIGLSGTIVSSGERLSAELGKLMANQERRSNELISEMRSFSGRLERLLEENSQKTLITLDEMRMVSQGLKAESDEWTREIRNSSRNSAILYFLFGFIAASLVLFLLFIRIK